MFGKSEFTVGTNLSKAVPVFNIHSYENKYVYYINILIHFRHHLAFPHANYASGCRQTWTSRHKTHTCNKVAIGLWEVTVESIYIFIYKERKIALFQTVRGKFVYVMECFSGVVFLHTGLCIPSAAVWYLNLRIYVTMYDFFVYTRIYFIFMFSVQFFSRFFSMFSFFLLFALNIALIEYFNHFE